jgi:DNA-binding LacI/PurR family transcriptional regulator
MNEESQKKVVLRQVAERAGISLGTASNVFTGKNGVAAKTRDAVLKAANELGYRSIQHPPTTSGIATNTLGFLLRSSLEIPLPLNQFYSHILYGVEQASTKSGLSLLYATLNEKTKSVELLPPMIQRKQVQGLLVVGYFAEDFFDLLQDLEIPFVMVDHSSHKVNADSVVSDNEQGGYLATSYLLQNVPDPVIATITGQQSHASFQARWLGYRRALTEHGIPYDEKYVCETNNEQTGGYHGMSTLLDLPVPPNAVFCCNDQAAIGALNALHARGLKVPNDCAIIGFDDIDMATYTSPPLTTIKVDKELLGAEGVRLLIERIEQPEMTSRRTIISVKLVKRESV